MTGRWAGQRAGAVPAAKARESRRCDRWVALGIVVAVMAGAVAAWLAGMLSR
jgi:hypothetical protein